MADSKPKLKKFINSLANEDYATAYNHLKEVLYEKTKKRCSAEYEKIKKSN
jgi:hypothetical protein